MTSTTGLSEPVVFVPPQCQRLRNPESQDLRRASSCGDRIFVDHQEIKFGQRAYLALVFIDGASNLLWATTLRSLEARETLGAFRKWTEESNCVPKVIVGDQSVFTDQVMASCTFHGITQITPSPCGPRTPWPNRAETAVRLFNRRWSIMAKALADEGYAEKVTVRQAVKKDFLPACRLRLCSPLEIATGRRAPDLFDVETSSPEQLSANPALGIGPLWISRGLP